MVRRVPRAGRCRSVNSGEFRKWKWRSGGADPAVSLSGGTGLAFTGGDPLPLVVFGVVMVVVGWVVRRRLLRPQEGSAP